MVPKKFLVVGATGHVGSKVVRNAAFMDVLLVMGGFEQAHDRSAHATTHRASGFIRVWIALVGNFLQKRGWMLAPGQLTVSDYQDLNYKRP